MVSPPCQKVGNKYHSLYLKVSISKLTGRGEQSQKYSLWPSVLTQRNEIYQHGILKTNPDNYLQNSKVQ